MKIDGRKVKTTTKCCYCGQPVALHRQVHHQAVCIHGSAGETLKKFMRKHAVKNMMMSRFDYENSAERKRLKLPHPGTLVEWLGSWEIIAEWCDLQYVRQKTNKMLDAPNAPIETQWAEARAALESTFDFSAIPAIDRGVKPVYNWRTMRYDHVHVLELR